MPACARFPRLLLALTIPLLLASAVHAERGLTRDFDLEPGGRLSVEASAVSIKVVASEREGIHLELLRGSDSETEILEDYEVVLAAQDDGLAVEIKRRRGWAPRLWATSLDLHVELPRPYDATIKTSGGEIRVDGLLGDLRAETSGGQLDLGLVEGDVVGRTSGGKILLAESTGSVDLRTSGGGIRVGRVQGAFQAHTSGGSIEARQVGGTATASTSGGSIDLGEVGGAIQADTSGGGIRARLIGQPVVASKLSTSGGSVVLHIDPSLALDLEARASGGRVDADRLTLELLDSDGRRLRGRMNGGGPKVVARSSGGGVRLVAER